MDQSWAHLSIPSYTIYRKLQTDNSYDLTTSPTFYPAKDSDELFDALRFEYPLVPTHSERMRNAMIDFLLKEREAEFAAAMASYTSDVVSQTMPPWLPSDSMSSPDLSSLDTPSHTPSTTSPSTSINHHTTMTLERMTGVFSLSTTSQPKQRMRRKMTDAEKADYRQRRLIKACEKCARRKRKCTHDQLSSSTVASKLANPAQSSVRATQLQLDMSNGSSCSSNRHVDTPTCNNSPDQSQVQLTSTGPMAEFKQGFGNFDEYLFEQDWSTWAGHGHMPEVDDYNSFDFFQDSTTHNDWPTHVLPVSIFSVGTITATGPPLLSDATQLGQQTIWQDDPNATRTHSSSANQQWPETHVSTIEDTVDLMAGKTPGRRDHRRQQTSPCLSESMYSHCIFPEKPCHNLPTASGSRPQVKTSSQVSTSSCGRLSSPNSQTTSLAHTPATASSAPQQFFAFSSQAIMLNSSPQVYQHPWLPSELYAPTHGRATHSAEVLSQRFKSGASTMRNSTTGAHEGRTARIQLTSCCTPSALQSCLLQDGSADHAIVADEALVVDDPLLQHNGKLPSYIRYCEHYGRQSSQIVLQLILGTLLLHWALHFLQAPVVASLGVVTTLVTFMAVMRANDMVNRHLSGLMSVASHTVSSLSAFAVTRHGRMRLRGC